MVDLNSLQQHFPDIDFAAGSLIRHGDTPSDQQVVHVPPERLLEVLRYLRDGPDYSMEQLADLTCVDYLNFPKARDRYGMLYSLLSLSHNHRLWLRCYVNDPDPQVPSATAIWPGAEWMEREVYDMFGIKFTDHPDPRRILTWEGFKAHPLRKDYPLRGQGEREDYSIVKRDSA